MYPTLNWVFDQFVAYFVLLVVKKANGTLPLSLLYIYIIERDTHTHMVMLAVSYIVFVSLTIKQILTCDLVTCVSCGVFL